MTVGGIVWTPVPSPVELTVASFNTHWGIDARGRPYDVGAAARSLGADVLVIQEVWRPHDGPAFIDEVVAATRLSIVNELVLAPDDMSGRPRHLPKPTPDDPPGTWGIAMLTALPVRRAFDIDLGCPPGDVVTRRAAACIEIDVEGHSLLVAGVHASHKLWGSPPQLRFLHQQLASEPVPSVIVGDCNMWGAVLRFVLPGRKRAVKGPTFPGRRPHSQIDHIWVPTRHRGRLRRRVGLPDVRPPGGAGTPAPGVDTRFQQRGGRGAGMAQEVRGVIARSKGAPVTVETIVVPDPGPGETVVRVQACGVCHTDLHYREGAINDEFPFLLGHEAAGIVETVGDGVTEVQPGDFVILNWRAVCGECRSCRRGRPWHCFNTHNATQKMTLTDGTELSPALGIGAFAEKTLVAAGQATKVNPAAKPETAGLLGCGVMAGLGAAMLTGNVQRGDTVAVFGCGGVGDAAIAGARLAGARTVIAVDLDDRKLAIAEEFGATHTVNAGSGDPVEAVRALTDGFGADVCIEAVGHPEVMKQAFFARDLAGTLVQVGVPDPSMTVELPMIEFFGRGGALKPSWYGDCLPSRDFPMLIDLYLQGRLDLDRFVTETISLDDVEEAFHKMERGEVLRSVVTIPASVA